MEDEHNTTFCFFKKTTSTTKLTVVRMCGPGTGFDNRTQLKINNKYGLVIYLFPVNQGKTNCTPTYGSSIFIKSNIYI